MPSIEVGNHLIIDPEICHGQMTFKGTRVPVETVLFFLAKGHSVEQLLRSWPELTRAAVEEAIALASKALRTHYPVLQSSSKSRPSKRRIVQYEPDHPGRPALRS